MRFNLRRLFCRYCALVTAPEIRIFPLITTCELLPAARCNRAIVARNSPMVNQEFPDQTAGGAGEHRRAILFGSPLQLSWPSAAVSPWRGRSSQALQRPWRHVPQQLVRPQRPRSNAHHSKGHFTRLSKRFPLKAQSSHEANHDLFASSRPDRSPGSFSLPFQGERRALIRRAGDRPPHGDPSERRSPWSAESAVSLRALQEG
jgi:hypothetical protein